jgi:NAD(P)-dependent dehydrogenase (short-subunit alcohol dehydrogenase family)
MGQRAVLVTGGSRGIGAAIARAFAAQGDRVAVHYGRAAEAAARVTASLPGEGHVTVRADMASPEQVRAMVDEAAARLDGLDVLVNNAGIYLPHPVLESSYEEWQQAWRATLDVNLAGAANATWCAVRHMVARGAARDSAARDSAALDSASQGSASQGGPSQGGAAHDGAADRGRVVNVGSRGAFRGEPSHPAYGASKAGLHAFGQSMARALAPHGIAVASVAPGYVATDMTTEELATPQGDAIRAQSPFGRVATPEEIAAAVLYLASPQAQWASGTVLDLNGASYLRLAMAGPVARRGRTCR